MTPDSHSSNGLNPQQPPIRKKKSTLLILVLVVGGLCVVSVPMIAIIAAIAIPNLLRSRIAANESAAIGACKTFALAEETYQHEDHDGDGVLEYATTLKELSAKSLISQKLSNADGTLPAPIPQAGYLFKILTAQGVNAPGGAASYIKGSNMTVGYALLAYPAHYDSTGRNTFIINQSGDVYQKDLGPGTENIVQGMKEYDPSNWVLAE